MEVAREEQKRQNLQKKNFDSFTNSVGNMKRGELTDKMISILVSVCASVENQFNKCTYIRRDIRLGPIESVLDMCLLSFFADIPYAIFGECFSLSSSLLISSAVGFLFFSLVCKVKLLNLTQSLILSGKDFQGTCPWTSLRT